MNVPNSITIARILLVPLIVWLIISGEFTLAFAGFLAAGIGDGVDGFLARQLNQRTDLGSYLDPIADKALLVSIYISLGLLKILPDWLVILVVSRDVLIVGAVVLAWVLAKPMAMKPSWLSKVNTAAQIVLAVTVLGSEALRLQLGQIMPLGYAAVGLLTFFSGALYMQTWVRHIANGGGEKTS
jgi:cardiolipin synthase (CMP-forming)